MRSMHLQLASWLWDFVQEARAGHPVLDMQAVMPSTASLLEHSMLSLNMLVKKLDAAMQTWRDLRNWAFADYPCQQKQVLVQMAFSSSLLPEHEAAAVLPAVPQQVVVNVRNNWPHQCSSSTSGGRQPFHY